MGIIECLKVQRSLQSSMEKKEQFPAFRNFQLKNWPRSKEVSEGKGRIQVWMVINAIILVFFKHKDISVSIGPWDHFVLWQELNLVTLSPISNLWDLKTALWNSCTEH